MSVCLLSALLIAQTIQVSFDSRAEGLLGSNLGVAKARLENAIGKNVRTLGGEESLADFLRLSANAQSLAQNGLGADYASAPDGWIIGLTGAAAIDVGDSTIPIVASGTESEIVPGLGAQVSLLVGYNFTQLGLPWLTTYVHGFAAPVSFSEFDGSVWNAGVGAQVRLLEPAGDTLLGWGGLSAGAGVNLSRTRLSVASSGVDDVEATIGGVRIQAEAARLALIEHTLTFPFEVSTSVRLLYFLSLYGGLGMDLSFGGANVAVEFDTTVSARGNSQSGTLGATFANEPEADRLMLRVFGGVQLNAGPIHLFAQLNVVQIESTLAGAAGLRITF